MLSWSPTHCAVAFCSHTNTVQKIPITIVYITHKKLLCLCVAACVCLFDYVRGKKGVCYVLLIIEFQGKNDVKKASLYLWLDRYPPVDRYTVIMWLSGVAAGWSLSCESGFPCIRESLLVYLSPPQRPTCTSRHQQDKTRCHIYEAVSSMLMPQRQTAGTIASLHTRHLSPLQHDALTIVTVQLKDMGTVKDHFMMTSQCYCSSLIFCHFKFPVSACVYIALLCVYSIYLYILDIPKYLYVILYMKSLVLKSKKCSKSCFFSQFILIKLVC